MSLSLSRRFIASSIASCASKNSPRLNSSTPRASCASISSIVMLVPMRRSRSRLVVGVGLIGGLDVERTLQGFELRDEDAANDLLDDPVGDGNRLQHTSVLVVVDESAARAFVAELVDRFGIEQRIVDGAINNLFIVGQILECELGGDQLPAGSRDIHVDSLLVAVLRYNAHRLDLVAAG